jgi:hypothetical protein
VPVEVSDTVMSTVESTSDELEEDGMTALTAVDDVLDGATSDDGG